MPYIQRTNGAVSALYTNAQPGVATEFLAASNAEVLAYLNPGPTESDYAAAVQGAIDAMAKTRRYADGVSLVSYKDSTVTAWAAEATVFIAWRDQVWAYVYAQLALVQSGQRTPQPSVAQIVTEVQAITLTWPS